MDQYGATVDGLMKTHGFPLRPAIKPLFRFGGYVGGWGFPQHKLPGLSFSG